MVKIWDEKEQAILRELLRELRLNLGIKQADLAEKAGFNQSIVSKYESGERRLDIIELRNICKVLGITLTDFSSRLENKIKIEMGNET